MWKCGSLITAQSTAGTNLWDWYLVGWCTICCNLRSSSLYTKWQTTHAMMYNLWQNIKQHQWIPTYKSSCENSKLSNRDDYILQIRQKDGKSFKSVQCAITGPFSAYASQAFSIAHCTDSEDLPEIHVTSHSRGELARERKGRESRLSMWHQPPL